MPSIKSDNLQNDLTILNIKNAIESKEDLENIIISYNYGVAVYLKDVANIEKSYDIQNKKEAILYTKELKDGISQTTLTVSKLKGSNSVTINEKIFSYMETKKDELAKKGIKYVIYSKQCCKLFSSELTYLYFNYCYFTYLYTWSKRSNDSFITCANDFISNFICRLFIR